MKWKPHVTVSVGVVHEYSSFRLFLCRSPITLLIYIKLSRWKLVIQSVYHKLLSWFLVHTEVSLNPAQVGCWGVWVLGCSDPGILGCLDAGVLGCWGAWVLGAEVFECWGAGMLGCSGAGVFRYWDVGVLYTWVLGYLSAGICLVMFLVGYVWAEGVRQS